MRSQDCLWPGHVFQGTRKLLVLEGSIAWEVCLWMTKGTHSDESDTWEGP